MADFDGWEGCDCASCSTGLDRWCCRACHDIARDEPPMQDEEAE